ncbi:MAG TPA: hypothetical protein VKY85_19315 [Candidatus Angelobacter sp.]|nr:hypothetical protein [Candidatus Angelobacter sp.]
MTTALRPMTTGELLDRTFNIYRNNFPLFAGMAALAAFILVASTVLLLVLGFTVPTPGAQFDPRTDFTGLAVYFLVVGLFYLIGASLATGATIYAVSKVHLGQPVNIGQSYSKVFPSLGRIVRIVLSILLRMLGVFLLVYLAAVAITIGLVGALGVGPGGRAGAGAMAGIATLLVLLVVFVGYFFVFRVYFKYSLAVQACVLERAGAVQSLKRSAFLTKGSLGRIFLVYLLMGVIGVALSVVLQLPATFLVKMNVLAATVWQLLATFVAFSVSFPISTIAISLLYYDQRVRKEAFDLQLMMEAIGQAPLTQAAANPIG